MSNNAARIGDGPDRGVATPLVLAARNDPGVTPATPLVPQRMWLASTLSAPGATASIHHRAALALARLPAERIEAADAELARRMFDDACEEADAYAERPRYTAEYVREWGAQS